MKLKHFSIFALLFLSLASCNKDEDDEKISTNVSVDIVGTWSLTDVSCTDGKTSTEVLGEVTNASFTITGKNYAMDVTFKNNPNSFITQGSYTAISKVTITGSPPITQEQAIENFLSTGTWSIDGNKFVIKAPGEPDQVAEILKLTSTALEYKFNLNVVEDSGFYKSTTTGTYVFKCKKK